jgi:hypothetical protein
MTSDERGVMNRFRVRSQSDPRLTDSCPFRYGVAGMEASDTEHGMARRGDCFFCADRLRAGLSLGPCGARQGKTRT